MLNIIEIDNVTINERLRQKFKITDRKDNSD